MEREDWTIIEIGALPVTVRILSNRSEWYPVIEIIRIFT